MNSEDTEYTALGLEFSDATVQHIFVSVNSAKGYSSNVSGHLTLLQHSLLGSAILQWISKLILYLLRARVASALDCIHNWFKYMYVLYTCRPGDFGIFATTRPVARLPSPNSDLRSRKRQTRPPRPVHCAVLAPDSSIHLLNPALPNLAGLLAQTATLVYLSRGVAIRLTAVRTKGRPHWRENRRSMRNSDAIENHGYPGQQCTARLSRPPRCETTRVCEELLSTTSGKWHDLALVQRSSARTQGTIDASRFRAQWRIESLQSLMMRGLDQ